MNKDDLKQGEKYYRWWDTGACGVTQLVVVLERVNRATVRVRRERGDLAAVRVPLTAFLENYSVVDF